MDTVKRKNVGTGFSMCVQPAFIVGTNNEDGSYNFAPITWVSATAGEDGYMLVVSMFGTKRTKQNVLRTGLLSVNLVSRDMLPLMDYLGTHRAEDGKKDGIPYTVSRGAVLDVPVLGRKPLGVRVRGGAKDGNGAVRYVFLQNTQHTAGRTFVFLRRLRR